MRKSISLCVLVCLMIMSLIIAGCGGDKFAGIWYCVDADMMWGLPQYQELRIEKNGKGYLLSDGYGSYKVTNETIVNNDEVMAERKAHPYRLSRKPGENYVYKNVPAYDITVSWVERNGEKAIPAVEKDGKLYLESVPQVAFIVLDEKNNTLIVQTGVKYKKLENGIKEKVLKDMQETMKKYINKKYTNNTPGSSISHKKVNSIKFVDKK